MTAARLQALTRHWRRAPPLPEVLAALAAAPAPSGDLDDLARALHV